MTYKDLETALLHLQYRLAQYECTLTDDGESRVQILSTALEDQRLCAMKSSDETCKQRLDTLEQQAKKTITEKHCHLRDKYSQTIESYLQTCIELHQWVSIPCLASDMVTRVAKTFYQISSKEQTILENTWQSSQLPIKKDFLQFKVEKSIEDQMNGEQIIRNTRWAIILGEPGSGKTSFAHWLVYYFAQTLVKRQYSTNYGPVRIPIFISIKEFDEVSQQEPSLTLFHYIEKQNNSSIISCALQDYIQQGLALIILDGFDDISTLEQSSKMIHAIEHFLHNYAEISSEHSLSDEPYRSEGNQLILMCRTGTFHTNLLKNKFPCYIIQPLDLKSITNFVDYYFSHIHQSIIDICHISLPSQAMNITDKLKIELESPQNADLLQMSSNPRLLSYICTLCFDRGLPCQRFLQYDSIMKMILSKSLKKISTIHISQLISILTEITSHIHHNGTSNTIHLHQIKHISIQTIKPSTNDSQRQVSQMLDIICHHLGIFTLRQPSHYAFLYRPFEHYFTCFKWTQLNSSEKGKFVIDQLNLEKKREFVLQMLSHHTSNQRFRLPIVLTLAKVSSSWSQGSRDDLCYEFIQMKHQYDCFIPFHSYLFLYSLQHFIKYPSNDVLFLALDRLIIAAGQHRWSIRSPFLFDQITILFTKLPKETISSWINQLLSLHSSHEIETIIVLSQLIQRTSDNIQWLDQTSCSILQSLSKLDNSNNGFAIDQLLLKISFSNPDLLSVNGRTFKAFLLDNRIEMNSIPIGVLSLIVVLYGGLERDGDNVLFNPSHIHRESSVLTPILIRYLSSIDCDKRDEHLRRFKEESFKCFVSQVEKEDQSLETIHLCLSILCLFYIENNFKSLPNSLLNTCCDHLKYISMILRQFYFPLNENDRIIEDQTRKYLSRILNQFESFKTRSSFLHLLNTLKNSLSRLRSSSQSMFFEGSSNLDQRLTLHLPNSLRNEESFLTSLLITDLQFDCHQHSCSLIHQLRKLFWLFEENDRYKTSCRMSIALNTIPEYLLLRNDEDILTSLTFVPSHLHNLFIRLFKDNSIEKNKQYLYLSHVLIQSLIFLSNGSCKRLSLLGGLINLLPWMRINYLDNLGCSLLCSLVIEDSILVDIYQRTRNSPINYQNGKYLNDDELFFKGSILKDGQLNIIVQKSIEEEQERLHNGLKNDLKVYSA